MNTHDDKNKDRNPDPITKKSGSHPIGTGIGAAVAGAAATGAAVGTGAGPVGTVAGAAVGAIVGGLAGKGLAEKVNPTVEEKYWRDNHRAQPYANGTQYEDYSPAYQVGYNGFSEYGVSGKTFDQSESELRRRYETNNPKVAWPQARDASRAAWDRCAITYSKKS